MDDTRSGDRPPPISDDAPSTPPPPIGPVPFARTYASQFAFQAAPSVSRRDAAPPKSGPPVVAVAFMLAMLLLVVAFGAVVVGQRSGHAGGDDAAEAAPARTAPEPPVICGDVEPADRARLEAGFGLMPRTTEGRRLYDTLVEHDVCTGVEVLQFNGGYALAERSWRGGWSDSTIKIDQAALRYIPPDVLAAMLVHEAAHIDRAIEGDACGPFDDCEVLDNGVRVEEEVAAHGAEARWWLDIYGPGGRRVASGAGYQMDNLVYAFQRGPDAFREFVIAIRSDPREGSGL